MLKVIRNFSMKAYWEKLTEDWQSLMRFKGHCDRDEWR